MPYIILRDPNTSDVQVICSVKSSFFPRILEITTRIILHPNNIIESLKYIIFPLPMQVPKKGQW